MFRSIFLLLACCLAYFKGTLRAQNTLFEKITIENGLSQGMIFDILQTRDGFLWVATKDGLNRYDGYNFKVFGHDPYDPFSVADDNTTVLFEDSRGWLWVGTANKGVDVYDPKSGLFHHVNPNFPPTEQVAFLCPRTIAEDQSGAIWVQYHEYGLVRVGIPEAWRQEGLPQTADLGGQTDIVRCAVAGWQPGREFWINIWAESDGTMTAFSSRQQYSIAQGAKAALVPHTGLWPAFIYAVEPDERIGPGGFWLLGESSRLYRVRDGKLTFEESPNLMWSGGISSIQRDVEGNIWLFVGERIWRLNSDKVVDFAAPLWTLDQGVKSIDIDRNGNVWVGTTGYGLRRCAPHFAAFHTGVAGRSIWRLWRSPKGPYFWRSDSDVYTYDPLSGKAATAKAFPELADNWVRDLAFEPSGAFWLLAAFRANPNQMLLCRYAPDGQLEQRHVLPIRDYNYTCFLRARNGAIWINGDGCQLALFDPQSAQVMSYSYAHLFKEKGSITQAFAIAEDGKGALWIGTQQGLVACTPTAKGMDSRLFQTNVQDPAGLSHNNVSCLLPDPAQPDKVLWVGTKGGGINRLDIPTGRFQHYGLKDGLPDRVIYGILPDNEIPATGRTTLWCSTNQGIAKLVPLPGEVQQDGKIPFNVVTYTAAKGLQDNEFNTQAYFKSAQGELLFGGINGLNHFFPEQLRHDTSMSPVFMVGLEVNHQTALPSLWNDDAPCSLECLRRLCLPYDQNNVSFEFALLDFTDPSKNRYRYRLLGLDDKWVENGTDHFAHFTHLAPGHYTLLVQGNNGESRWADCAPIELVIRPPWWRTSVAYLLYVLLLGWAAWRLYRFQIQRVKEREQLAFEQRETERIKAVEQVKANFFNNITHEFRTPLTLILEPLRQLLQTTRDPSVLDKMRLMERNSQNLLGLVNQLLDMAKIESGNMHLDLRRNDLVGVVRNVFEPFLPLAEKQGVKLNLAAPQLAPFVFDAEKVEIVLRNLLSNALKFTPEGGRVELRFSIDDLQMTGRPEKIGNRQSKIVNLHVSDTGIGIPEESLDKIFDRFYQVDGSSTRASEGTGIGLALSKELALMMGGDIRVTSQAGKGSTFTFLLPMKQSDGRQIADGAMHADENHAPAPLASAHPAPAAEKPVVLVIEDNLDLRNFIKTCIGEHAPFSAEGFGKWEIVEASDGEDGIKKAIELLPDIVVSDLMMPRKDGFSVVNDLKNNELTAHIPIILLTAKAGIESKLVGLRQGADDYLTKPFSMAELLARMENLVAMRQRLRVLFGQQAAVLVTAAQQGEVLSDGGLLSVPDREFLQKFALTLEKNLDDTTISVEGLAEKMHISRTQLHRKLKALTDKSATDFIRDYRLDCAHAMLKNREGLVYEIAARVGFGDEKYFSRAFKEKFGVPPSQLM